MSVSLSHISCHLAVLDPPAFCQISSEPIWIEARPWLARLVPSCTTELACAWLYVVMVGTALLVISLLLAVAFVQCCDSRLRAKHRSRHDIDQVIIDFDNVIPIRSCLPRLFFRIHYSVAA